MTITPLKLHELFEYKDGNLYRKINRKAYKAGSKAGSIDRYGYTSIRIEGKNYLAHRLIYLMHHGNMPKFIDHIDGDKTNNKIENLRPCELVQNSWNAKISVKNTSGVKNVMWHKRDCKWQVTVSIGGRQKHFGYYDDLDLAELVAIEARNKYHKQFARHK